MVKRVRCLVERIDQFSLDRQREAREPGGFRAVVERNVRCSRVLETELAALTEVVRHGRWRSDVTRIVNAASFAGAIKIRALANVNRAGERVRLAGVEEIENADVPVANARPPIEAA